MKPLVRRVSRLEVQCDSADRPRARFRLYVHMGCATRSLNGASCKRALWPDGTLFETVRFRENSEEAEELSPNDLDRWIESFPVK
jgi:hypothetical protein